MFRKIALASPLAFIGASAFAAVPEAVTQSLTTGQADALTIAGAVLAAIVAVWALKLARRAL